MTHLKQGDKPRNIYRYWNTLVRDGGIGMMVGGVGAVIGWFRFHEPLMLLFAGLSFGAGFAWWTFYQKTIIEL